MKFPQHRIFIETEECTQERGRASRGIRERRIDLRRLTALYPQPHVYSEMGGYMSIPGLIRRMLKRTFRIVYREVPDQQLAKKFVRSPGPMVFLARLPDRSQVKPKVESLQQLLTY